MTMHASHAARHTEGMRFDPYSIPISSTRSGAIFHVHPYPTKINYQSIIPFILAHTRPGDLVYDCFAGTCSTALAAAACAEHDPSLLTQAGLSDSIAVRWGPRRSACVDIGVLPTFIGQTLLEPIDIGAFWRALCEVMDEIQTEWGWIYRTVDDQGQDAKIRYTFFSDHILCPHCNNEARFVDIFVDFRKGAFHSEATCPDCGDGFSIGEGKKVTEKIFDDVLRETRSVVKRTQFRVFGKTGRRYWARDILEEDLALEKEIMETRLPKNIPATPMMFCQAPWGEMYRSGYHRDITHVHHFYTRRNLIALGILYEAVDHLPERFRNHYLLAISSYNAAHSTLMTRFVFKKDGKNPVVTSAQPGALYIGSCPVEKNVFLGVKRKAKEMLKAIGTINRWEPEAEVYMRPAQDSGLPLDSVDYVFTDPPFGNNLQYSELNFLSEAWLGRFTDNAYETIVSKTQDKTISDYGALLTGAFEENFRVLKPGRHMTVVFHKAQKEFWNLLRRSISNAGFDVVKTSILDKRQTSFKQTTTEGAVWKDLIILARKPLPSRANGRARRKPKTAEQFLEHHLQSLGDASEERSFDYLYTRYVGDCIGSGAEIEIDAGEFKKLLSRIARLQNGKWYLRRNRR